MSRLAKITRRSLLVGTAAVAGGVVFGFYRYKRPYPNPLERNLAEGEFAITPYIRIDQAGITIITPRAEMGQGVHSTLAALVAEELDVDWEDILVEHGPASKAYYNSAVLEEGAPVSSFDASKKAEALRGFMQVPPKLFGLQLTGASSSIPDAYNKMRLAGAAARDVLLSAAAVKLGIDKSQLKTERGFVVGGNSRLAYTSLALDAQKFDPPSSPKLKTKSEWKLLGKSLPRVDMVDKCMGSAEFSVDVRLPKMRFATVKMNPHLGGEMLSFDASEAEKMRGVEKIIALNGEGVAVIASNTWYAFRAAKAIRCEWAKAKYPADTKTMFDAVLSSFNDKFKDSEFRDDGNVDAAFSDAKERVVEAEYRVPYLAHATMEPLNATAFLQGDRLEVWAGNQNPTQVLIEGKKITGLPEKNIRVHTTYMGGGFGRRAEMDFIKHAIVVAKAMAGTPIKLTWSREEDMTHDAYRPLAVARFKALIKNGSPQSVDLQVATPSVIASQVGRMGMILPGPDTSIVRGACDQPYVIENYRVRGYRVPEQLPVSSWRSVGASQNGFFHETMIDELAHQTNEDPLAMRLRLISHKPSQKVLEAAAELANWGRDLPNGHGLGLAFTLSFGVPTVEIVEVASTENGIKILNVYAAVDVGTALDPRNIEAQVISGINFGLAAAMMGEITVKDGKVEQTNFHDYDAIRMHQAPDIAVKILEYGDTIRGIGEPGTPPAAPALGNAIFAATGKRIRELPFNKQVRFV